MKTKKNETKMPKYLTKTKAYYASDLAKKYTITANIAQTKVKTRNIFHLSSILNGIPFIFIDQIRE
jgi:hypothetical protein